MDSSSDDVDRRQVWARILPWLSLVLLVLVALVNVAGYNFSVWFLLPVGLGLVALVFAVRARRWLDALVSVLVVLAIPLWLLGLVFLFQFVHLENNSFSP